MHHPSRTRRRLLAAALLALACLGGAAEALAQGLCNTPVFFTQAKGRGPTCEEAILDWGVRTSNKATLACEPGLVCYLSPLPTGGCVYNSELQRWEYQASRGYRCTNGIVLPDPDIDPDF